MRFLLVMSMSVLALTACNSSSSGGGSSAPGVDPSAAFQTIVFERPTAAGGGDLFSVPIDGGIPVNLTRHLQQTVTDWLESGPQGLVLYQQGGTTGDRNWYAANVANGGQRRLTAFAAGGEIVERTLFDENYLVLLIEVGGVRNLFSVPVNGNFTDLIRLTDFTGGELIWRPTAITSGGSVVYEWDSGATRSVHAVHVTGGERVLSRAESTNARLLDERDEPGTPIMLGDQILFVESNELEESREFVFVNATTGSTTVVAREPLDSTLTRPEIVGDFLLYRVAAPGGNAVIMSASLSGVDYGSENNVSENTAATLEVQRSVASNGVLFTLRSNGVPSRVDVYYAPVTGDLMPVNLSANHVSGATAPGFEIHELNLFGEYVLYERGSEEGVVWEARIDQEGSERELSSTIVGQYRLQLDPDTGMPANVNGAAVLRVESEPDPGGEFFTDFWSVVPGSEDSVELTNTAIPSTVGAGGATVSALKFTATGRFVYLRGSVIYSCLPDVSGSELQVTTNTTDLASILFGARGVQSDLVFFRAASGQVFSAKVDQAGSPESVRQLTDLQQGETVHDLHLITSCCLVYSVQSAGGALRAVYSVDTRGAGDARPINISQPVDSADRFSFGF